jgi:hypothetical protein
LNSQQNEYEHLVVHLESKLIPSQPFVPGQHIAKGLSVGTIDGAVDGVKVDGVSDGTVAGAPERVQIKGLSVGTLNRATDRIGVDRLCDGTLERTAIGVKCD